MYGAHTSLMLYRTRVHEPHNARFPWECGQQGGVCIRKIIRDGAPPPLCAPVHVDLHIPATVSGPEHLREGLSLMLIFVALLRSPFDPLAACSLVVTADYSQTIHRSADYRELITRARIVFHACFLALPRLSYLIVDIISHRFARLISAARSPVYRRFYIVFIRLDSLKLKLFPFFRD